jgi:DNA repair photolyase
MVAPVLPMLTDSDTHLDDLLGRIAAVGASRVTVFGLHLRGSTRGWFMDWLARTHPHLVAPYRELYRRGAYLPEEYRDALHRRVTPLLAKHGLAPGQRPFAMRSAPAVEAAGALQPTLF